MILSVNNSFDLNIYGETTELYVFARNGEKWVRYVISVGVLVHAGQTVFNTKFGTRYKKFFQKINIKGKLRKSMMNPSSSVIALVRPLKE